MIELRFQFALKDSKAVARHAESVIDQCERAKASSIPPSK